MALSDVSPISPLKASAASRQRSMSVAQLAALRQGERPTIGSDEGSYP